MSVVRDVLGEKTRDVLAARRLAGQRTRRARLEYL